NPEPPTPLNQFGVKFGRRAVHDGSGCRGASLLECRSGLEVARCRDRKEGGVRLLVLAKAAEPRACHVQGGVALTEGSLPALVGQVGPRTLSASLTTISATATSATPSTIANVGTMTLCW